MYDQVLQNLIKITIHGIYWGNKTHTSLWADIIKRIGNCRTEQDGYTDALNLQKYPLLIIIYTATLMCLHTQKYVLLNEIYNIRLYVKSNTSHPITTDLYPEDIIPKDILNQNQDIKLRTPLNDRLHTTLYQEFEYFIPLQTEYNHLFNFAEYLYSLLFAHHLKKSNDYFWAPIGRFGWYYNHFDSENNPSSKIKEAVKTFGAEWTPLKAGLFEGSLETLVSLQTELDEFRARRI